MNQFTSIFLYQTLTANSDVIMPVEGLCNFSHATQEERESHRFIMLH